MPLDSVTPHLAAQKRFLLFKGPGSFKIFVKIGGNALKGLSHEIDFKNFDKKLHNLALLRVVAGFLIF